MNLTSLQALLGPENVSNSREDRLVYNRDASRLSGKCLAVVWPTNAEQVAALVAWSLNDDIDLVPRGAGTGLCGGATPQNSVVVDLTRIAHIDSDHLDHNLIHVGAGVVLDMLNRYLVPQDLFLPVIPGSHRSASIGGMIATDAAGLRAVRYGSMQNWVEDITLVDGWGQIQHLTGNLLVDVAGREGVTGFIVEAVLRLTDLPRLRTVSLQAFDDLEDLLAQRERWLGSPNLTALEYINRPASAAIGWEARAHLLAEFDSTEGQIADLQRITDLWRDRDGLYPVLARQGYPVIEDPQIGTAEHLGRLLFWLESENIPAFGHLGMGIVHPCFGFDDPRVDILYQRVSDWNGRVSGEHGVGIKKKAYTDAVFRNEIQRLRAVYNPHDTINRGKLC
jgi:FAD/FMN-containing dehydrogenase